MARSALKNWGKEVGEGRGPIVNQIMIRCVIETLAESRRPVCMQLVFVDDNGRQVQKEIRRRRVFAVLKSGLVTPLL